MSEFFYRDSKSKKNLFYGEGGGGLEKVNIFSLGVQILNKRVLVGGWGK